MRGREGERAGPLHSPRSGRRSSGRADRAAWGGAMLAMTLGGPMASPALDAQQAPRRPAAGAILPAARQAMDVRDDPASVGGGRVAAQVTLGTVGTLGGFVAGGLATRWVASRAGADPDRASRLAYVGAWTSAALLTPVAPVLL